MGSGAQPGEQVALRREQGTPLPARDPELVVKNHDFDSLAYHHHV